MASVTISERWTGLTVDGKFPLLRWLGGAAGCGVFLTELRDRPAGKAAIKLMSAEAADAENRAAGWAAAWDLEHRNLLRVLEWGRCRFDGADLAYVVTEYAPEVLAEILPERSLSAEETRAVLDPLVGVLEYLHGKGLVHGHVKPANLLAVGDELKLTADHLVRAGAARGAMPVGNYGAPELTRGEVTPAVDVWSLGVTLVEMLTQSRPVRGTSGEPVIPDGVPEPFAGIARACLRVAPADRCSLGEIRARLRREAQAEELEAEKAAVPVAAEALRRAAAASTPARVTDGTDRGRGIGAAGTQASRTWIWVAGVIALVAVLAIAWFLVGSHPKDKGSSREQAAVPAARPAVTPAAVPAVKPGPPVTVKGAVKDRIEADVLRSALDTIYGTVVVEVRVTVGTDGNVSDAVYTIHGPSRYFADAGMKAARQWKFKPAEVNGRAVKSQWLLRFAFTKEAGSVTAREVSP